MNLYEIITTQQDPQLASCLEEFVRAHLSEFKQVLSAHPLKRPTQGCISVTEAFWVYYLIEALRPEVVIESGSLEGYSLHFLERAAPQARIYSFDPFVRPKAMPERVQYHACDWTQYDLENLPGNHTVAFFDDHLHQGKRLHQALRRRIRHLLFHDNYVTPFQSHVPVRYCNLLGLARYCYTFDRLQCDPIFVSTGHNPQGYRWLTYVELETELSAWGRWYRRFRYDAHKTNPYKLW